MIFAAACVELVVDQFGISAAADEMVDQRFRQIEENIEQQKERIIETLVERESEVVNLVSQQAHAQKNQTPSIRQEQLQN